MPSLPFKSMMLRLRKAAPYLIVELLLPGGTLLAVLLWLSRNPTAMRDWSARYRQPRPRGVAERVIDSALLMGRTEDWALPVRTA
jgi:hypothetical protein